MIREPAVAGQFYPAAAASLRAEISRYSPDRDDKSPVHGVLCPHAGYVFSGPVAGAVFAAIEIPSLAVILCPSHRSCSPPFALWMGDAWKTPLGEVRIDAELSESLAALEYVSVNNQVHAAEHSGEVVLPFLQYHRPNVRIAVICICASASAGAVMELGRGIASCLAETGNDSALVVASSDISHEQGPGALDTVKRNDTLAVKQMERLDPSGLMGVCSENGITMCGVLPAAAMMESARARGGKEGRLILRSTSADSPHGRGDYVVGYAGMIFP